jgi:hypothetical protein
VRRWCGGAEWLLEDYLWGRKYPQPQVKMGCWRTVLLIQTVWRDAGINTDNLKINRYERIYWPKICGINRATIYGTDVTGCRGLTADIDEGFIM